MQQQDKVTSNNDAAENISRTFHLFEIYRVVFAVVAEDSHGSAAPPLYHIPNLAATIQFNWR